MPTDATGASLPELFRSLNVDPGYKEALVRLAETVSRLEHESEHQQMLFGAAEPPPPPPPLPPPPAGPRHKRERHLRVIPGGMAALVPLMLPGHGAPGLLPVMGHVWLGRRAWPRWVLAAAALGLAGATIPATASDGPSAHHTLSCVTPRAYHPDRRDGDRDDKTVVALLPAGCAAAGEGGAAGVINQGAPSRR